MSCDPPQRDSNTDCSTIEDALTRCNCWGHDFFDIVCYQESYHLTCVSFPWTDTSGKKRPAVPINNFTSVAAFCSFCTIPPGQVIRQSDYDNAYFGGIYALKLDNCIEFTPSSNLGAPHITVITLQNITNVLTTISTQNLAGIFKFNPVADSTKCPIPLLPKQESKTLCFSGKYITNLIITDPNYLTCKPITPSGKYTCTMKYEDYSAIGNKGSTMTLPTTLSTLTLYNFTKFATKITSTTLEELHFLSESSEKTLDDFNLLNDTLKTLTLEKIPSTISGTVKQISTISFLCLFKTITSLDGSLTEFTGLTTLNLPSTLTSFTTYLPTNDPKPILDFTPSANTIETIDLTGAKFAQLKSSDFSTLKILNKLILPSDTTEDNLTSLALPESLKTLNLAKTTKITNISFDASNAITTLTLPSDTSKLNSIDLSKTQVKLGKLNGVKLPSLRTLIAGKNTDDADLLKFTPIPSLFQFNLASTTITKCAKDLSLIKDLTTLTLADKIISYSATLSATVAKLTLPSSLQTIDLSGTTTAQLTSRDFSGYASLQSLTLGTSENAFNFILPKNSENFTTLSLQKTAINPFGPNLADLIGLTTLTLPVNLKSYSATLNSAFKNLSLPTTLTTIDLSGTTIAQLKTGGAFSSFDVLDSLALGPDVVAL